ncbi:hypothetical protein [Streptomyces sp. G45]
MPTDQEPPEQRTVSEPRADRLTARIAELQKEIARHLATLRQEVDR